MYRPEEEWLLPSGAYRARLESDLALDCHHHHTNDALVVAAGMTISHREAKDKESKAGYNCTSSVSHTNNPSLINE